MPDDLKSPDLMGRIAILIITGLVSLYVTFQTQDRFTGTQGHVLMSRVERLERDVQELPPEWLRRDLMRIEKRLERIEQFIESKSAE